MDTIDVTNLNRQFLFRPDDVGKMKAQVAAAFIERRVKGVRVNFHTCMIQEKDEDFYRQFNIVVSGLDNIKARRWLNAMLHQIVDEDEETGQIVESSIIPMIDGGTEAFNGQTRLIVPYATACFECTLGLFPPQVQFQLCTVAETPRKPEHCIAYVMLAVNRALASPETVSLVKGWEEAFGAGTKLNKDNPGHMRWIFERALVRAEAFNISGVTYMLTMGVVKNIIPAIASTNAIIAAACVNEAFKALSWSRHSLDNNFSYRGSAGVYSLTHRYEKKEGCPVCGQDDVRVSISGQATLAEFIEMLKEKSELRLEKPSLQSPRGLLYFQNPPSLREATTPNLSKKMAELIQDGDQVAVTDPMYPQSMNLSLRVSLAP